MLEIGKHAMERMNERNITEKMISIVYQNGAEIRSYNNTKISYVTLKKPFRKNCVEYRALAVIHGENTKSYGDRFLVTCEWVPENVLYAFEQCRKNHTTYYSKFAA